MVNRVILVGNLGRDAELRYTPGGSAVSTFNVACTEKWKDKQGKLQERTEWVRVVLWGKVAESLNEYLMKGKQVYVEGKLATRSWDDKDGNKRYQTEVKADQIRLLGGKGGAANGQRRQAPARGQQPAQQQADPFDTPFEDDGSDPFAGPAEAPAGELTDDDIPF
jgi:single-strand DNA-binding protein